MAAAPARERAAQLFNLLAAHAALDPELGYAQGCRPPPRPRARPHSLCMLCGRRQGVRLTRLVLERNSCVFSLTNYCTGSIVPDVSRSLYNVWRLTERARPLSGAQARVVWGGGAPTSCGTSVVTSAVAAGSV